MLDNLTQRLSRVVKTMRGQARLTEANTQEMLREVRMALLEADVALPVVREFVARVKEHALGQEVVGSLNPGQALVGVVHKELTTLMGGDQSAQESELSLATQPPAVILMAGLQGAGKTTTTGKLAKWLAEGGHVQNGRKTGKKKVLVVSVDVYRPAAIEQLKTVAGQGGDQPAVEGVRVVFDAYCGSKKVGSVKVDLVVGSMMTAAPEENYKPVLELEGLKSPKILLYPVVDHIADKLCATQARYGYANNRSSRVRDLVDLVVFARTQNIDGAALTGAISSEWAARKLAGTPSFDPPLEWQSQYSPIARGVPACGEYTSFESATSLTTKLLAPACRGETAKNRWESDTLRWVTVHREIPNHS